MDTRILFSDNGTTSLDLSNTLDRLEAGTWDMSGFSHAQDHIYMGLDHPINSFYLHLSSADATILDKIQVEYWTNDGWTSVVDAVVAEGDVANSGWVDFTPNKNNTWKKESSNDGSQQVTGITDVVIYDKYWLRLSFSSSVQPDSPVMSYLGPKLCGDESFATEYPDLVRSDFKSAYSSGRTDWADIHVRATNIIFEDLKRKGVIYHPGQILRRKEWIYACISKSAQIIYAAMGDDYVDQMNMAKAEYRERFDKTLAIFDLDKDGMVDLGERMVLKQGKVLRRG